MNIWRRVLIGCTLIVSTAFLGQAAHATPTLGIEYVAETPPQPTHTGNKIEVLELFWYGCPHCYHLEPLLEPWVRALPRDVAFRRMPAALTPAWVPAVKVFYTMKALGILDAYHERLFDAVQRQGLNITDPDALANWFTAQGVNRATFTSTYRSFAVANETLRAEQMTRAYGIDGVPSIVVGGEYMTSPALTGGEDRLLPVVDYLIQKVRAERARHASRGRKS
ncbi:MAG: thiol:disulfide interchange protein DsbA/DsbL [Betaproteobacteria bacterium]|nr:thiol:disulfide interchange protein DsbA/DsbL [Betaproteobacteria bacterium]